MVSELRILKNLIPKSTSGEEASAVIPISSVPTEGMQGQVRMNLFRGVKDHGQNQLDLLSFEIEQMEQKLKERNRERLFTQRIVDVMNQFYSGQDEPTV